MVSPVFSNRDLVRKLISDVPGALPLLRASSELRRNEPCASAWERWQHGGCPEAPVTAADADCLAAIGGTNSPLCALVFDVQVAPSNEAYRMLVLESIPNQSMVKTVQSLLTDRNLSFMARLKGSSLLLQDDTLTVTRDGWRQRGAPCRLGPEDAKRLVAQLLSSVGDVQLPCQAHSSAGVTVTAKRSISIEICRRDSHTKILTASRR